MHRRIFNKENMRGYQLVIHGYFYSCMVFFFVQFKGKEFTSNALEKSSDAKKESVDTNSNKISFTAMQAFLVSLVGTALAEIACLPFYYPFDLIKVRMQTMHDKYGYRNFIDGFCKVWNERKNQKENKLLSRKFYLASGNTFQFPKMFRDILKIR
jgi:hypothetical protein